VKTFLFIVFWLVCSYVNWGLTLGHFSHEFPYMQHTGIAGFGAMLGPFGIPVSLLQCGPPYRFQLKPTSTEERWKIYHARFPSFSRDDFEERYN
jgi:hypothetical protein